MALDPALGEADFDEIVRRVQRFDFAGRIDREHRQRPRLRQAGGDIGAQFGDHFAPGRGA